MMPSLVYAGSQVSSMLVSVTLPILNFPGCPGTEEGNKTNVICMDISSENYEQNDEHHFKIFVSIFSGTNGLS